MKLLMARFLFLTVQLAVLCGCANAIICPDQRSECPAGNTCCMLQSGVYACCPMPQAGCCSDHVHCCPRGYTCSGSGECVRGNNIVIDGLHKIAATTVLQSDRVQCPDGKSYCPDGNTCCELVSGGYGCCPVPQAVCCSDHVHCCPRGYTCSGSGECVRDDNIVIDGLHKIAATTVLQSDRVQCPDGKSYCPDGNTCCELVSGGYGCCPVPQAVCCSDHVHCCPRGYTCSGSGVCVRGDNIVIDGLHKIAATTVLQSDKVQCPDGKSYCPDGNTCCELVSGEYGCCPVPQAVCCSDHVHCCPRGYTCSGSGVCVRGDNIVIDGLHKIAATTVLQSDRVQCPDGKSYCPDGNTCCELVSGEYGCCPVPQAVCCSDHVHCCPRGYTCSGSGECVRGDNIVIDGLHKIAATTVLQSDRVQCPDGKSYCPDGNTCCELVSGGYGCCPVPQAVCCSDHVHCCPRGYTCSGSGVCVRGGNIVIDGLHKIAATTVLQSDRVQCPDGKSYCPDGNTCCELVSGEYGCCPVPQAVCCSDHVHCCPRGYTCSGSGVCVRGDNIVIDGLHKIAATTVLQSDRVQCPDGKSYCPDGNTCCELVSGEYGCCPVPQAVCCSDHVHCCPRGYMCSGSGECVRGDNIVIDGLHKIAATTVLQSDRVQCPDGKSYCPDGNTCCELVSGGYGCCPVPQAVCCSDHVHCCPRGYTCSGSGVCVRGDNIVIDGLHKIAATTVLQSDRVQCPDGKSYCPDGNTCCELVSGEYGCCPVPQAVCCSDHVHCCPRGYTCSGSGECVRGDNIVIDGLHKIAATTVLQSDRVQCPDGKSYCPDGNTCCELVSGGYGCCPVPQAVCCSDHVHCCPRGYTCSGSGVCVRGDNIVIDGLHKIAATTVLQSDRVQCPDGKSYCPDGNTCCELVSGEYGCCPVPQAVCCSDHVHCCPRGYMCSGSGECVRGDNIVIDGLQKIAATTVLQSDRVQCPDGKSYCPDGNTCCELVSGGYGCCPVPQAVCCSDHVHCCPRGYTCSGSGVCVRGDNIVIDRLHKIAATTVLQSDRVQCPDGKSYCPDGNTCCELVSGEYGCCPVPQAVCCSDHVHCCPRGYTCSGSGECVRGDNIVIDELHKIAATTVLQSDRVQCPDGKSYCPDGNTCCELVSGGYGCCPVPQAVCCSDHVHCCPRGYTCSGSGECVRGDNTVIDGLKKIAATTVLQSDRVQCPDGKSYCPDGNTCCELVSGRYGCCPVPQAVCCSDHVHCCPRGYTCSGSGVCVRGDNIVIDGLHKIAATTVLQSDRVQCPDGKSYCPDGNTCCELVSGEYGCCPVPQAVCCSDHVHCCPRGYTCSGSGECVRGDNTVIDGLKKIAATTVLQSDRVQCPDGKSYCPDGNTCCELVSGRYGCCPVPQAVCCSDHVHCCPRGYTCSGSGECVRGDNIVIDGLHKIAATTVLQSDRVQCPDGKSYCPDGNTCCELVSGEYGCCPVPQAVCCSDHVHCCPRGYTCSGSGECVRGDNTVIDGLKKIAATTVLQSENVVCPDQKSECPDGNTCCELVSGGYGCCPVPQAVCCSDHVHCCPNGYTCSGSGDCVRGDNIVIDGLHKIAATKVLQSDAVQCPDGKSECPAGNTCCMLQSGLYACCPLPHVSLGPLVFQAVCCSDHVHCCPNGYTCSGSGECVRGDNIVIDGLHKIAATKVLQSDAVQCPDGKSECPAGNTCCMLQSGLYACCPLPQAVCCSDHVHCCPNGYTCSGSGECVRGDNIVIDGLHKIAAMTVLQSDAVQCPDGKSECPDGNTCCKLISGEYGCCPVPQAVCCSDHVHCCPRGYTCSSGGECVRSDNIVIGGLRMIAATSVRQSENVVCPDQKSECPDGNTCCELVSGGYGCCPVPQAVCCSDHVHCCPRGYTCSGNGECVRGDNIVIDGLRKIAATSVLQSEKVVCPDQKSECPDGSTCCLLASGSYGCCRFPQAVCCSDHVHCCPSGYQCDVQHQRCTKGSLTTAWLEKTPATALFTASNGECPDHKSSCPDGQTCCQLASGEYGCCPVAKVVCPGGKFYCSDNDTCCSSGISGHNWECCPGKAAVCCSDHLHCCPAGTTCDMAHHACRRHGEVLPWQSRSITSLKPILENSLLRPKPKSSRLKFVAAMDNDLNEQVGGLTDKNNIICPDHESRCPTRNMCCPLQSGGWACCPLPAATCCSDGLHCCPSGYKCDMAAMTCRMGYHVIPLTNP